MPPHTTLPYTTNNKKIKSLTQILTFSSNIKRFPHYLLVVVPMATSISATGFKGGLSSSFHGSWGTPIAGEAVAAPLTNFRVARPIRSQPMMKNVNEGKGLFAPIVVITRNIIGKKRFNQLRGKAIALHSQVITEFCKSIGADSKQRQGLIRLAKKNGERLGFLA